jgi:broad specificity phosphatase PhoE
MEVFFLRHGQTNGNVARRHQHTDTPLNEMGVKQVEAVASEVVALRPTHIVSSTQLRAIETTRIVATACDLIPETHAAFIELKRPEWLVGYHFISPTTLLYVLRWFWGSEIDRGESYGAFLKRIETARLYLEALPPDARVVVVSHSVFTNVFIEQLCRPKKMNLVRASISFLRIFTLRNAGLVRLRFDQGAHACGWTVLSRQ